MINAMMITSDIAKAVPIHAVISVSSLIRNRRLSILNTSVATPLIIQVSSNVFGMMPFCCFLFAMKQATKILADFVITFFY